MSKVIDFLSEVRVELSKVVWPTTQATFRLTVIVVIVALAVGFFVGAVDALLAQLMTMVVGR